MRLWDEFEDELDRREGERIDMRLICPYCKNDDARLIERLFHNRWVCTCCSKQFEVLPRDERDR
jgi:transposase-like protein